MREVTADFSGLKAKVEEEDVFIALGSSKASKGKKEQRSTNKTAVEVSFTVAPSEVPAPRGDRPPRGGRGEGRGGDRPRSGRGEGRGDRPKSGRGGEGRGRGPSSRGSGPKVDFSDASAFPSL